MAEALLDMRGIDKRFGRVHANRRIDLCVEGGSILGLLGENGSGKSTLMKILFGLLAPDAGEVIYRGRDLTGRSPREVMSAGVGMIHQHFMLIEAMSVVENVMLRWHEANGAGGQVLRRAEIAGRIREMSAHYGLELNPDAQVSDLSLGGRQRVEIVKALLRGAELLVLDEPTSNLSPPEVDALMHTLRRIREDGKSIIFISHKLGEVLELCDRVVVLRAGAVAAAVSTAGTNRDELGRMIVGDDIATAIPEATSAGRPGRDLLIVDGLSVEEGSGRRGVSDITFALREGEILAIAGVDGNGQKELAHALAGLLPVTGGRVLLCQTDITRWSVARRVQAGVAYVPADRSRMGLVQEMTVAENLVMRDVDRSPYSRFGVVRHSQIQHTAKDRIAGFRIRTSGPDARADELSGGNQQKIVLGRELGRKPRVLVAHQPTWGLDPGAARFVMDQLLELRAAGAGVVFISSELEEVLALGDRVGVLFAGCLVSDAPRGHLDASRLGRLMAGDRTGESSISVQGVDANVHRHS